MNRKCILFIKGVGLHAKVPLETSKSSFLQEISQVYTYTNIGLKREFSKPKSYRLAWLGCFLSSNIKKTHF